MRVNNIFCSLQGEGLWTGMPMTFLRLQGCNLRCPWCDTAQALAPQGGVEDTVAELAKALDGIDNTGVICITGGEPLTQKLEVLSLCNELHKLDRMVHLETNGTIGLTQLECSRFDWITVSPKPPDYACKIPHHLVYEMKLVVGAATEVRDHAGSAIVVYFNHTLPEGVPIWLQPDNNRPEAIGWIRSIIENMGVGPLRVGLSLQMHKLIGIE